MFKLMTIIVQTMCTKGFTNVTKQVIRNIAIWSFNFQFQCINCSLFCTINFVFEITPQKEVHGREAWGTHRIFNGTPSSNPRVWKTCIEVSSYIAMVVGRCSILLKVTLIVITKLLWNLWTDKLLKQLKWVHFFWHTLYMQGCQVLKTEIRDNIVIICKWNVFLLYPYRSKMQILYREEDHVLPKLI